MTASQAFTLLTNGLALVLTLGSIQVLVLRHGWRLAFGRALGQFLGSLALLQSATLLTQAGLLAGYPPLIVEGTANLALMSTLVVALTALALLLHASHAMRAAWQVANRSGVTGMIALLPAFGYYDLIRFPTSLDETLMSRPYTAFGAVIAVVCTAYLALALAAVWRYWRQIDTPLLTGSVTAVVIALLAELGIAPLRGLGLAGAVGGIASSALGYCFLQRLDADPRTSQDLWLRVTRRVAHILTINQPLQDTLAHLAEQVQRLVRSDTIIVMLPIGSERLEVVVATRNELSSIVGRQIRQGEGLAGRVMQTLYPMRVDDYRTWNGRAADLGDLPIYASMSVPLLFDGRLVGVVTASETAPGRTFTDRDQLILELLAPQMALMIVTSQLGRDLHTARAYLQGVLDHTAIALLIFDSAGMLCQANPRAQEYLRLWFGNHVPSAIEFAAHAEDTQLTDALVQWAANPTMLQTLETAYPSLGRLQIELQPIRKEHNGRPDLLVVIRPISDLSPA
jgi:GAF domain-containing protein